MSTQAHSSQGSRLFPKRFMRWQCQCISARASSALALADCDTVKEITRLGRDYFEGRSNCAMRSLAELAALVAWPLKVGTAVDAIAATLALAIDDPDEAHDASVDVVIALRRSGFVTFTKRQEMR